MSNSFNDDLLSAYFDDETSSEERTEVERRLESSDAAKQELDDIDTLSRLIRELPGQSAPEEFRAAVMQKAEQATLFGSASETSDRKRPKLLLRWKYTIGSILATAAAIFVMLSLLESWQPMEHTSSLAQIESDELEDVAYTEGVNGTRHGAPRENTTSQMPHADALVANAVESYRDARSDAPTTPTSRFANRAKSDSATTGTSAGAAAPMITSESPTENALTESRTESFTMLRKAFERQDRLAVDVLDSKPLNFTFPNRNLNDAEVGQVVEAVETSGERVVVVQLTVVDRQAGLESLQLLLSRNQIAVQSADALAGVKVDLDDASTADSKEKSDQPGLNGNLIAVYVEASGEQLSSALGELNNDIDNPNKQGPFRELVLDRAIALSELTDSEVDGISRSAGKHAQAKSAPASPTAPADEAKRGVKSAEKETKKRRAESPKPAADKVTEPKKSKDGKKLTEEKQKAAFAQQDRAGMKYARQLQLSVPRKLLSSLPAQKEVDLKNQAFPSKTNGRKTKPTEATLQKKAGNSGTANNKQQRRQNLDRSASIQVLFVLVAEGSHKDAPTKPTKPAQKANATPRKPNDGAA